MRICNGYNNMALQETFDQSSFVVMIFFFLHFSGGKDSLTQVKAFEEVAEGEDIASCRLLPSFQDRR